jgi:two-component system phosphate regulon sensor histidine kinase PhoR
LISKYKLLAFIILPAAAVLIAGLAMIQQKNQQMSRDQFEKLLYTSWHLASLGYIQGSLNPEEIQKMTKEIGFRITLLNNAGHVIYDSQVAGEMESHSDRPEVKAAAAGEPIFSARDSESVGVKTLYYARKISPDVILRVASPMEYYETQRSIFVRQTVLAVVFLIGAVLIFGLIVFGSLSRVYREMSRAVRLAKDGGQELPSLENADLDEALFSLSKVTRELKDKNRENEELNRRLIYILSSINEGVIFICGTKILFHNRRAEEILGLPIPESVTQITKKEVLDILAQVRNSQPSQLKLGSKTIQYYQTHSEDKLLAIFHDQTEKEKYLSYKSDLIGNISHELKTPLALILGTSEVILKDTQMPRPILEKFSGTLYKNALRLNSLLDDLILLHQLESRPETINEECDLEIIRSEIEEMVDPGEKKVEYIFDRGTVNFHGTHLLSILTNLINNAVKYSQGSNIQAGVHLKDNCLEISVADEGPAIPESEHERIFERFYSRSASRTRSHCGSGLGLAIVKHLARLYQGQVRITVNELGGNTFWVRLTQPAGPEGRETSGTG